jgi:uncharacterized membrane protein YqaE (UPF0057 family)
MRLSMRYLLALVLPPVAVLLCGKPFQAILNVLLCLLLIVPGVIHAMLVVRNHYEEQRTKRLVKAFKRKFHP